MSNKCTILARNIYGTNRGYPADRGAELFLKLIRTRKTFDSADAEIIQEIADHYGFSLEFVTEKERPQIT